LVKAQVIGLTATAAALERQFRSDGYLPGVPPGITALSLRQVTILCRMMKCPGCKARGLEARSFASSPGWRVLACCPRYPFAEEV
jgi:hypothetical protein